MYLFIIYIYTSKSGEGNYDGGQMGTVHYAYTSIFLLYPVNNCIIPLHSSLWYLVYNSLHSTHTEISDTLQFTHISLETMQFNYCS